MVSPEPPPLLTLATDDAEESRLVQHGLRDMLLGWDEQAALYFYIARARVEGETSPLAVLGTMLTRGVTEEDRQCLQQLLDADVAMTPQELDVLGTLLRLLRGEQRGAGEEFAARAERFRRDWFSACWAALLLHDGYDENGSPMEGQKRALAIAQGLYGAHADKGLACYIRALVEETAPQLSAEALEAARKAAALMPEHPAPQLLLGHLLYRSREGQGALDALTKAVELSEKARNNVPHGTFKLGLASAPLEIRARLYLATALYQQGRAGESRALLEALRDPMKVGEKALSEAAGYPLLHWEARTLPLRCLMLRTKLPTNAEVSEAVKFSADFAPMGKQDLVRSYHDCLRFCVVARQRAAEGRAHQAALCVKAAQECLTTLQKGRDSLPLGGLHASCHTRAVEACSMALLAAKAACYPDTADIWLKSLELLERPAAYLMPPVLPRG